MNTNKILTQAGWGNHPLFPEIARLAEIFFFKQKTAYEILKTLDSKYENIAVYGLQTCPYKIYGTIGKDIDYKAVDQMLKAAKLPVASRAALMPDGHVGYALPIGGVIELYNAVSPSFVGYDIACRVSLSIYPISPEEFMQVREHWAKCLLKETSFGKGAGGLKRSHPVMSNSLWNEQPAKKLKSLAADQLGSSGGGNHFADLLIGTVIKDAFGLKSNSRFVALMTHSGSRGTGKQIAEYFVALAKKEMKHYARNVPNGYEYLPLDTNAGQDYLNMMHLMGEYAKANHELIHTHFSRAIGLAPTFHFENHHNFAWVNDGIVIHRKGATPAYAGIPGIIPGSSGTASYLVRGLGNREALYSSSHGAGRLFSRSIAKQKYKPEVFKQRMQDLDILFFGVEPDETFMAYKDIDRVMSLQADIVEPIAQMWPKVVVMGGKADDG